MKGLVMIVAAATLAGCVSTQVTRLAGFDPARPATCPAVVRVYASGEAIGGPFIELAYLKASATDVVENEKLIESMKEKAATVGANGILLKGFGSQMGGPGLVTSAFVAKPTGEAIAIWVPADTVRLEARCAGVDAIVR